MSEHMDATSANTPDQSRPGDHHGQDGGRDTIAATDAQKGRANESTQDVPAMSQNDADAGQKIEGIVAQTRADVSGHADADASQILAERLAQAGIALSSDEFDAVVARLTP